MRGNVFINYPQERKGEKKSLFRQKIFSKMKYYQFQLQKGRVLEELDYSAIRAAEVVTKLTA